MLISTRAHLSGIEDKFNGFPLFQLVRKWWWNIQQFIISLTEMHLIILHKDFNSPQCNIIFCSPTQWKLGHVCIRLTLKCNTQYCSLFNFVGLNLNRCTLSKYNWRFYSENVNRINRKGKCSEGLSYRSLFSYSVHNRINTHFEVQLIKTVEPRTG